MKRFPKVGKRSSDAAGKHCRKRTAETAFQSHGNTRETVGNTVKVYRETFPPSKGETFPDPAPEELKDAHRERTQAHA